MLIIDLNSYPEQPIDSYYNNEKNNSKTTGLYDEYMMRTGNLEKILRDTDKMRAMYYKWFTGRVWGKAENYHMLLKSDVFDMDGCTDIILYALERKKIKIS